MQFDISNDKLNDASHKTNWFFAYSLPEKKQEYFRPQEVNHISPI